MRRIDYSSGSGSVGTVSGSTYSTNLQVTGGLTTISGTLFSPPLITEPSSFTALAIDGASIYDVTTIIDSFVKNGIYYDLVLTEITQVINNVKFTIY